ncbi:hypothetical protein PYS60_04430 [Amygdalobacter indicium]|jgi:hypothetical protein|uniref:hypothetical protein n=1 Tax=Amygdalobacter indicium TaxID=3029272 RepID=UPI0027A6BACB|nr:hypothetical protein [Amygdalobacter indicium]WEG33948.1 hypothetical protein PYS60_04430 [Amygdalobacter indicium]
MKNYCKKTFLGLLAFAILFSTLTNIVPVYASEDVNNKSYTITNEIASNFRNISEIASKSYDVKDMELKDFYIELAKNEIYNKNIVIKGGIDNLNFNEINVVKSNIDGKYYTSVNVSVGGEYSLLSNLNIMFNENDTFEGYTETLIYNNDKLDKFIIDNYQNGKLIEHKQTDIDYINNGQIREGIRGLKDIGAEQYNKSWYDKVGCIAALLGVNGTVAYLIAGTCTAACLAEPVGGAVCAACIGGVCVLGAADIGAIVACFKL